MNINKNYVVYILNNVLGSNTHKALEPITFNGFKINSFKTEEEAIQALVDDERTYEDFMILLEIYITEK